MASFFFSRPAFMLSGFAFPDPQHAGGGAVADLSQSAALLHGDRARRVSERRRGFDVSVAADAALAVYGVMVLGLSAMRFHKTLD